MKQNKELLLGAHMSIAGGYNQAIIRAESIGCTAFQIFTKSNRQWEAKTINEEDAQLFKKTLKTSTIRSVIAHASYLINVGSQEKATEKKSIKALIEELERCATLGIPYLVLHPGSGGTATSKEECIKKISANLDIALGESSNSTVILLENTAGQGYAVGSTFQELADIRSQATHKKRIGFCFDTCHAFAAGYDLSNESSYKKVWHTFDTIIGKQHLKAIHLNDSKQKLGSHIDRHQHIGKGQIGLEAFALIINDPTLFEIPKILETPKEHDGLEDHYNNLQTLKGLLTPVTKEELSINKKKSNSPRIKKAKKELQ